MPNNGVFPVEKLDAATDEQLFKLISYWQIQALKLGVGELGSVKQTITRMTYYLSTRGFKAYLEWEKRYFEMRGEIEQDKHVAAFACVLKDLFADK
jgi:hypothetical protein